MLNGRQTQCMHAWPRPRLWLAVHSCATTNAGPMGSVMVASLSCSTLQMSLQPRAVAILWCSRSAAAPSLLPGLHVIGCTAARTAHQPLVPEHQQAWCLWQVVRPSYDVNERRNRERSLFGLTDKRAPTPLKYVLSSMVWFTGSVLPHVQSYQAQALMVWCNLESTSTAHAQCLLLTWLGGAPPPWPNPVHHVPDTCMPAMQADT